jgi:hypothetical protein
VSPIQTRLILNDIKGSTIGATRMVRSPLGREGSPLRCLEQFAHAPHVIRNASAVNAPGLYDVYQRIWLFTAFVARHASQHATGLARAARDTFAVH